MNHLDRCQTDLDVTIVRADSPTTHIATITETQADEVRSYTLTLPDETTAGQDDAIGAAAYQAIRDRTHDLQAAAAAPAGGYLPPWITEAWPGGIYPLHHRDIWPPFLTA